VCVTLGRGGDLSSRDALGAVIRALRGCAGEGYDCDATSRIRTERRARRGSLHDHDKARR